MNDKRVNQACESYLEGGTELALFESRLSGVERKVLQYRSEGNTLNEISNYLKIEEEEVIEILNRIKLDLVALWSLCVENYICPCCNQTNIMNKDVTGFECEMCDKPIIIQGNWK